MDGVSAGGLSMGRVGVGVAYGKVSSTGRWGMVYIFAPRRHSSVSSASSMLQAIVCQSQNCTGVGAVHLNTVLS